MCIRDSAGAVGAHDGVGLAGRDRQVNALEDLLDALGRVDGHVQVLDVQGAHAFSLILEERGLSTSTSTRATSIRMGYAGTGSIAGSSVTAPVRRSKRAPWAQHSTSQPMISPSDNDTSPWLQMSLIA